MLALRLFWTAALLCLVAGCDEGSPQGGTQKNTIAAWGETAAKPNLNLGSMAAMTLEWEEVLRESVSDTFGKLEADYFDDNRLVSEQVIWGIGIPDRAMTKYTRLADGNILVSGCRHHDCFEKGAIVATPQGKMLAAALINHRCVFDRLTDELCLSQPRLTTFYTRGNDGVAINETIERWAKQVSVKPYDPVALHEKVSIDDELERFRDRQAPKRRSTSKS